VEDSSGKCYCTGMKLQKPFFRKSPVISVCELLQPKTKLKYVINVVVIVDNRVVILKKMGTYLVNRLK